MKQLSTLLTKALPPFCSFRFVRHLTWTAVLCNFIFLSGRYSRRRQQNCRRIVSFKISEFPQHVSRCRQQHFLPPTQSNGTELGSSLQQLTNSAARYMRLGLAQSTLNLHDSAWPYYSSTTFVLSWSTASNLRRCILASI